MAGGIAIVVLCIVLGACIWANYARRCLELTNEPEGDRADGDCFPHTLFHDGSNAQ
jgi:hypothetical protein